MYLYLILAALFLFAYVEVQAATKWSIDQSHSKVQFGVTHLVISEVTGQFNKFDGTIESPSDDFTDAKINFVVDVNSIDTDNQDRDNHLKSDDFFNAEKYPEMKFNGKSMKNFGGNKYKLTGDLTVRDITKEITLDVLYNGTVKDPWGNTKAGFKITGELNRFDYGLKWNALVETGGAVVGKTINLNINLELNKA